MVSHKAHVSLYNLTKHFDGAQAYVCMCEPSEH